MYVLVSHTYIDCDAQPCAALLSGPWLPRGKKPKYTFFCSANSASLFFFFLPSSNNSSSAFLPSFLFTLNHSNYISSYQFILVIKQTTNDQRCTSSVLSSSLPWLRSTSQQLHQQSPSFHPVLASPTILGFSNLAQQWNNVSRYLIGTLQIQQSALKTSAVCGVSKPVCRLSALTASLTK